jgi:adenylyltransferase/sulfurtransferase
MNDDQLLRYSRQIMLPEVDIEGQEKLLDANALIIGLGGLGSPVAMYLAAAGVGHLTLVDFDTVDLTNLQRQIVHHTSDVDRPKVESARDKLLAINPGIQITCINQRLEDEALLRTMEDVDVVVDCCDNFSSRFAINETSVRTKTPLVSGAATRFEGQVSVFNPQQDDSPCYRCLYRDEGMAAETCTQTGVMAPLLGIIGSVQAMETMKVIMGIGESLQGRLLLLDGLGMEWHSMKLRKDPKCPVCNAPA